ncbi:MAG: sulfatase-like hydrolase/transferase, partial [Opitutaceae bacterium]
VAALEKRGLMENTLILFSSDNGGPTGLGATNRGLRAGKGTLYEGGVRVPAFASWRGRITAGTVVNTPLHIVDWYPTLLALAGAETRQALPLDGRDAWATITKGAPSPHQEILINSVPRSGAIRMDDWKLVLNGSVGANDLEEATGKAKAAKKKAAAASSGAETVELFNLAADPSETNNLAAARSEVVAKLRARLEVYTRAAVPPKAEAQAAGFKVPRVWGESR